VFDAIQQWDLLTLSYIRTFKDPAVVWFAWAASTVAWKGWLWWLTIAGAWLRGRRHFAVQLALALLVCIVCGLSLKGLIARPRPDLYASIQLNIPMQELLSTQHSFPSGHTLLAGAFAFVVICFFRDWRAWLAVAFVVAVSWARVYQGMHWPSDCIGSVLMGVVAGLIAAQLCKLPIISRFAEDKKKPEAKPAPVKVPTAVR
jgi:undecaprenyl-diphosphatase